MKTQNEIETIDATPTWSAILPLLLEIHANAANPAGRRAAAEELQRMAQLADRYVSNVRSK